MAKNKKLDLITLILFGVMAVSVIMVIVGVCIDWTSTTTTASGLLGGGSSTETAKLADWAEANGKAKDGIDGYGAMAAFAYITLVLAILTAIAFVVSKFVDISVMKWVVVGLAALTVISAVVAIITTYTFCDKYQADIGIASAKTSPAAGLWLTAIFGMLAGGAGITGALKK